MSLLGFKESPRYSVEDAEHEADVWAGERDRDALGPDRAVQAWLAADDREWEALRGRR